eukprot:gene21372-22221_t
MRYVDEFRDPAKARVLLAEITTIADRAADRLGRAAQIMEVCGGHTHSIFRYGIGDLLPKSIELVHGPGCPVCVLPMGRVDDCVAIAELPGVIFATFGDAMRVPGSKKSLLQAKAEGADVRMVYSPLDALRLARDGYDIVLHCHSQRAAADAVAAEIPALGRAVRVLQFDIGERAQCADILLQDIEQHEAYYGVVCNAGIARDNAFPAMSGEDWDS